MFRDFSRQVKVLFSNFRHVKIADNTLKAVFNYAISQLDKEYPENEVRSMISVALRHFFNYDAAFLSMNPNIRFTESELLKFVFLVKELRTGRPLQYVLGECEFYGLSFSVNEDVLIPRQETEELVDLIIKDQKNAENLTILDIGCGSGCIGLALSRFLKKAQVHSSDVSEKALIIAKQNADKNNVQLNLIHDDILKPDHSKYPSKIDIIVSNPPYVRLSEKEEMHRNVVDYEPHTALFVNDENALVFYDAIADFGKLHFKKGAYLYFEINEKKSEEISVLLSGKGFSEIKVIKDLNGKDRIVRAKYI